MPVELNKLFSIVERVPLRPQLGKLGLSRGQIGAHLFVNASTWSRASARVALANADITQAQYVALMQAISGWEQAQNSLAKATPLNGGDSFPV
jgi:hypothetical protein